MIRALLLMLALAVPAHAEWTKSADGCNYCNDDGTICTSMWCGSPPEINAIDYSLLEQRVEKGSLERCIRRCEKNNPAAPTPQPTQSLVPVQCESIGTGSIKTFTVGEERRLCFTSAASGSPIVEVGTQNHGNASCADFWMQMYSPTGAVSEMSNGAQPGVAMMPRVAGKYYIAIGLTASNSTTCSTLTFTVR